MIPEILHSAYPQSLKRDTALQSTRWSGMQANIIW